MKQTILALFVFLSIVNFTTAQDFDNNEKIQEMRVKFYNEQLQFTDEEKQNFWPLFEEFKKGEKDLKKQFKPNQRFELMSDAQAEEYILKSLDHDEQLIALKRQYVLKIMKKIPIRKVAMLSRTERQFKRKILNEVKKKRKQQGSK